VYSASQISKENSEMKKNENASNQQNDILEELEN